MRRRLIPSIMFAVIIFASSMLALTVPHTAQASEPAYQLRVYMSGTSVRLNHVTVEGPNQDRIYATWTSGWLGGASETKTNGWYWAKSFVYVKVELNNGTTRTCRVAIDPWPWVRDTVSVSVNGSGECAFSAR